MNEQIAQRKSKFKTALLNFHCDSVNYLRNKISGRLSKLSARFKWNVIRIAVQDCTHSSTIKTVLEFSVASIKVINVLKYAECLNYNKFKLNPKL